MGKYFGTDGARGKANDNLTIDMAIKIGQFVGYYFSKRQQKKIVIGKDTRLSSDMFESALAAGASSCGIDVYLIGTCPTPCVAYNITKEGFACGIMVSASHNPYHDNGIKLFNSEGYKMDSAVEDMIEAYIDGKCDIELAACDHIGRIINFNEGLDNYKDWLVSLTNINLNNKKIALDLANGSTTTSAKDVLEGLGAQVVAIHDEANGYNINEKCGSTHPESLQELVKKKDYYCGFAFDGDGDRLIAVNEDGELVDGDHTMYICGKYLNKCGKLKDHVVVTTVMSNLGLYKALDREQLKYEQVAVGDKYVFECMQKEGYSFGGEQSGHIIFLEHENTGDGLLTAIKLLEVMVNEEKSLKELSEGLFIYPQLLKNTVVKDKEAILSNQELWDEVKKVEDELNGEGRVLLRASGTEPLIRVMVEAKTDELCDEYVERLIKFVEELEKNQ